MYESPNSVKKIVAKLLHGMLEYLPTNEDIDA
jgi:hypothetical protein